MNFSRTGRAPTDTRNLTKLAILALAGLTLAACGGKDDSGRDVSTADTAYAEKIQEQLIDAKPGDVIEIPAGVFSFERSLSLDVDNVTIRGQGMDKTILSFKNQIAGAEGLLVKADDFTIEDLAIEDSKGDALKINEGENIIIRRVRTEWTGGPKTENGAYGLYPVQTTNVLIEDSVAIAASDAGIYVGQSKNVILRRNRAEYNVAGIEIENTIGADVYDNVATNNTGGILVFNMPHLVQEGRQTRVFKNQVYENNTKNFGHKGTPVASVPAGSGIVINSNDEVEIFDNDIRDNKTANIIVSSVFSTGYKDLKEAKSFDPYPESIYIHDNRLSGGGNAPDGLDLQALRVAMFGPTGRLPDILWDGFADPAKMQDGALPPKLRICVNNGDAKVINADGPHGYKSPSMDQSAYACTLDPLPEIHLPF